MGTWLDRYRTVLGFGLLALSLGSVGLWLNGQSAQTSPQPNRLQEEALEALRTMQAENDALVAELEALKSSLAASTPGEAPMTETGSVAGASDPPRAERTEPTGRVNLNTATKAELESLPGIGPSKAQAILDYRNANGPFTDPTQLKNVKGIGDKTYEGLKDQITVQ